MDISIIFKLAAIGIIITIVCQILKKSDRDDVAPAVTMIGDLFQTVRDIFGVY